MRQLQTEELQANEGWKMEESMAMVFSLVLRQGRYLRSELLLS